MYLPLNVRYLPVLLHNSRHSRTSLIAVHKCEFSPYLANIMSTFCVKKNAKSSAHAFENTESSTLSSGKGRATSSFGKSSYGAFSIRLMPEESDSADAKKATDVCLP